MKQNCVIQVVSSLGSMQIICKMGISAQFGIENYEWRLGIDQNVCEYYWVFA